MCYWRHQAGRKVIFPSDIQPNQKTRSHSQHRSNQYHTMPALLPKPNHSQKAPPPRSLTDDEYVVELLDAVDLGEQLVDHGVVHPGAAGHTAALLTDRVQLVKDDDVQARVGAHLTEKGVSRVVNRLINDRWAR